jgi:hypothetical protein
MCIHKELTIKIKCTWNRKTKVIAVIRGACGSISKLFRQISNNTPRKHDIKELHEKPN